jgi:hypothetical protein
MGSANFENAPFTSFFENQYSQNGEDGIINEILNRLEWETLSNWVVEFGAWDGKHLSNTFALVENKGFKAVFIEGDSAKYQDLLKTAQEFQGINPVCEMVSNDQGKENSLDNLLNRTDIPVDFDVLSIDIDTFDLDIWESFTKYHPKVVIIEINSGIMPGILSRHNSLHDGNSFSSTLLVAAKKNYTLV